MSPVTLESYLVVGAALFGLGAIGFLARRNLILMFLSAEMMLQGVALNFVAFSRWRVERCFEDEKGELGLDHYEGRKYRGLKRHMILTAVSHLFLAKVHQELRGEKPGADPGAGVPGAQRPVRGDVPPEARDAGDAPRWGSDPVPPTAECPSHEVAQETAAWIRHLTLQR